MATILIIDDNETIREGLAQVVRKLGHLAHVAPSGPAGIALLDRYGADFVITDLKMEGMDGVAVLEAVRTRDPDLPTMIVTAFGTIETAVQAMKLGAFDFLEKPFAPEVVQLKVERALALRAAQRERTRLGAEAELYREREGARYGELVGSTEEIVRVFAAIERVAPTDAAVAIVGETGTGKELVARAIHARSRRAAHPFITVNCGSLVDTLLESELFGHEKGAFTGAIKRKLGRFELADGGTLFLDEIGDVSTALQLKLLRVLQERAFERVGGEATVRIDVRLISATHKDLKKEVAEGRFREDLYYRLQVVPIAVPPLRERKSDLAPLVSHFIRKLAPRTNPGVDGIEARALDRLAGYAWPGNVRELENVIEQALVFADGPKIGEAALPRFLLGEVVPRSPGIQRGDRPLPDLLDELERGLILEAYQAAQGVKTETARLLGIKTSALYYKLEKYGIG